MNALKSHPRVTFWGLAVLGLAVAFASAYWLRQAQAAPVKTGEELPAIGSYSSTLLMEMIYL